jgi:formylglycine-generating enzyme required for sulfatase activity
VTAHLYLDFRDDSAYPESLKKLADAIARRREKPRANARLLERYEHLTDLEKAELVNSVREEEATALPILARALQDSSIRISGSALQKLSKWKLVPSVRALLSEFEPRDMILIRSGQFLMGEEDEAHWVSLPSYYIDKYPVTNAQYASFIESERISAPPHWVRGVCPVGKENHPVAFISWFDARDYATWIGKRLPSDAEWEKAASWDDRREEKRMYPWGNDWNPLLCNMNEQGSGDTNAIGSHSPQGDSAYGIADMFGNIREWTSSLFRQFPYDPTDDRDNPALEGKRVVRGKSWGRLSTWGRIGIVPRPGPMRNSFYRFRCALTLHR